MNAGTALREEAERRTRSACGGCAGLYGNCTGRQCGDGAGLYGNCSGRHEVRGRCGRVRELDEKATRLFGYVEHGLHRVEGQVEAGRLFAERLIAGAGGFFGGQGREGFG